MTWEKNSKPRQTRFNTNPRSKWKKWIPDALDKWSKLGNWCHMRSRYAHRLKIRCSMRINRWLQSLRSLQLSLKSQDCILSTSKNTELTSLWHTARTSWKEKGHWLIWRKYPRNKLNLEMKCLFKLLKSNKDQLKNVLSKRSLIWSKHNLSSLWSVLRRIYKMMED